MKKVKFKYKGKLVLPSLKILKKFDQMGVEKKLIMNI